MGDYDPHIHRPWWRAMTLLDFLQDVAHHEGTLDSLRCGEVMAAEIYIFPAWPGQATRLLLHRDSLATSHYTIYYQEPLRSWYILFSLSGEAISALTGGVFNRDVRPGETIPITLHIRVTGPLERL